MATKIIKLTEQDLTNLVKQTIKEMKRHSNKKLNESDWDDDFDDDTYSDTLEKYAKELELNDYDNAASKAAAKDAEESGEFSNNDWELDTDDKEVNNDPKRDEIPEEGETNDNEPNPDNGSETENSEEGPISDLSQEEEPEEQHEEGDVIMYEDVPINYHNGRYWMVIEDGYDLGGNVCPKIEIVGDHLKDIKDEYHTLWDGYYYTEHSRYAKEALERGEAEYQFNGNMMVGDNMDYSKIPILIDLDKKI